MHVLCEAICGANLSNKKVITDFIHRIVNRTGLHLVHLYVHVFPNGHLTLKDRLLLRHRNPTVFGPGITAAGVLAESHITLHTRPEIARLDFDLFSCRPFDVEAVRDMVEATFEVQAMHEWVVRRR